MREKLKVIKVGKPEKIVKLDKEPGEYYRFEIYYGGDEKYIFEEKLTVPKVLGFVRVREGVIIEPYTVAAFARIGMMCTGRKCKIEPSVNFSTLEVGGEIPIPKDEAEIEAIFRDVELKQEEEQAKNGYQGNIYITPRYDQEAREIVPIKKIRNGNEVRELEW